MNNKDIKMLDKNKLKDIFLYLNERLRENQLQLELTIYGGTVMTMVYDNRPATRDIDCVFSNANVKLFSNILELTKYAFGLSDGWINDDIKEPLSYLLKEEKESYIAYSNLKILKPRANQLLAMKILAARPEPAKDFIDANILCETLNITTKDQLLKVVSEFVPLNLLGERQIKFIEYLGKDLGYDWK